MNAGSKCGRNVNEKRIEPHGVVKGKRFDNRRATVDIDPGDGQREKN